MYTGECGPSVVLAPNVAGDAMPDLWGYTEAERALGAMVAVADTGVDRSVILSAELEQLTTGLVGYAKVSTSGGALYGVRYTPQHCDRGIVRYALRRVQS